MDWRDLIAWQQVRVQTYSLGAADVGPVLVAQQNPSRIYLSISQNDGDNPHTLYPGPVPPGQTCGIPIGGASAFDGGGGALAISGSITGTIDPATGTVNETVVVGQQTLQQASVPATLEFWLDRHGALAQYPWWFIADGCTVCVVVVEVIQDRNPCDFTSTGQMLPARPAGVGRGRSVCQSDAVRRNSAATLRRRWNVVRVADGVQFPSS